MQLKELAHKLGIKSTTLHAKLWVMGRKDPAMLPSYVQSERGRIRCDYSPEQVSRLRVFLKKYPVGKPGRPKGSFKKELNGGQDGE